MEDKLSKSARYFWVAGSLYKVENNTVLVLDTESWTWKRTSFSKEDVMSGREASINDLLPLLKLIS